MPTTLTPPLTTAAQMASLAGQNNVITTVVGVPHLTSTNSPYLTTSLTSHGTSFSGATFDPQQSLTINTNGRRAPNTEQFKKCRNIFLTDIQLCNNPHAHFHFLVWEKIFGNDISDYGSILRNEDGLYIAFGSQSSRDQFDAWMKAYSIVFFSELDTRREYLPTPLSGDLRGVFVPDNRGPATYDPTFMANVRTSDFDDWVWIVSHCYNPVIRLGTGWLFAKDVEAIHFKMR